jgi:O-antigen/teichoic acid export membrane protein
MASVDPAGSFKQSAVAGIKWTSLSHITGRAVALVSSIVLARLLAPGDFGLAAMAMVVIGFVDLFSDLGTTAAVVQRQDVSDEMLSTVFWFNVLFGLLATLAVLLIAPFAADFYREPRVAEIMHWLAFTFFAAGLRTVHQAVLQRSLAFNRLAALEIAGSVISSIVGVTAAYMGYGVWSLVYQSISGAAAMTALFWAASKWRPRFVFRFADVASVANYSLHLTGHGIFNYFARNADNLLIGRFLGAQDLGYYDLAYRILLYPLQASSSIIGRVVFPIYSKIQDDNARFRSAYIKVAGLIALVTFPVMFGVMAVAQPLVLTLFGAKWAPMIPLLMIFAPISGGQTIGTTVGAIYQAKGRADWLFRWGLLAGIVTVIAFAIGLQWGVVGVAISYAVITLLLTYPSFAIPFRLIELPVSTLVVRLWRPSACTVLMLAVVFGVRALLPPGLWSGAEAMISVAAGALSYALATWWLNRAELREALITFGVKI